MRVAGRNGAYSPGAPFDLAVHLDPSSCTGVDAERAAAGSDDARCRTGAAAP